MAGLFASYLGLYYVFRLVNTPLSSIFKILGREKTTFYFSILSLLASLISMSIGIFIYQSAEITILMFSIGNLIVYVMGNHLALKLVGAEALKIGVYSLLRLALVFLAFYGIKSLIEMI